MDSCSDTDIDLMFCLQFGTNIDNVPCLCYVFIKTFNNASLSVRCGKNNS